MLTFVGGGEGRAGRANYLRCARRIPRAEYDLMPGGERTRDAPPHLAGADDGDLHLVRLAVADSVKDLWIRVLGPPMIKVEMGQTRSAS